jgi:hypothetical protein
MTFGWVLDTERAICTIFNPFCVIFKYPLYILNSGSTDNDP